MIINILHSISIHNLGIFEMNLNYLYENGLREEIEIENNIVGEEWNRREKYIIIYVMILLKLNNN